MSPLDISLADLIAHLDEELPDADELARISEARLRAQTLSDLGDQLIDHYVSKAKRTGASWTEIGDAIGVSKQAAQQRHAPTRSSGSPTSTGTASCWHRRPPVRTSTTPSAPHTSSSASSANRGAWRTRCWWRKPSRSNASATRWRKHCHRPGRRRCGVTSRSGRRAKRPSSRHAARRPTSATTGSARSTCCWA
ncbi:hypothetical protein NKH77_15430 [Streptomyces sp. M19]